MPDIGEPAPEFDATIASGASLRLSSLRGAPVVLYFYPEADTPGCTIESKGFRDLYPALRAKGVHVIGVSVDPVEAQAAFAGKYGLPFPLVADTSKEVAQHFGALGRNGKARRMTFFLSPEGTIEEVVNSSNADVHVGRARARYLGGA